MVPTSQHIRERDFDGREKSRELKTLALQDGNMDLDLAVLKEEVGAHLSRAVDMGETVVGKAGTVQERKRVGIGEAELLARRTSD